MAAHRLLIVAGLCAVALGLLSVSGAQAASGPVARGDPQRVAHDILTQRRFRRGQPSQPLRRFFRHIGRWFRHRTRSVDGSVPGGRWVLWALFAAVVAAAAAVIGGRWGRRLRFEERKRALGPAGVAARDPRRLERDADAAQIEGDHGTAVRLRFQAGLLRLDAREVIELRPSLTTGQIRRALADARFDELARTFDEIAYGHRAATERDAERARGEWPRVLEEAASR